MSAIKVGDLAAVTKPQFCCGRTASIGFVIVVTKITSGAKRCNGCGAIAETTFALFSEDAWTITWVDIRRLTKIDPPAEPTETRRTEEIMA